MKRSREAGGDIRVEIAEREALVFTFPPCERRFGDDCALAEFAGGSTRATLSTSFAHAL